MSTPYESSIYLPDSELQHELLIGTAAGSSNTAEPSEPTTTSLAAKIGDDANTSLAFYNNTGGIAAASNLVLSRVTNRVQGAAAYNGLGETESEPSMAPHNSTLDSGTARSTSVVGPDNSRHSQNEKYCCPYSDCPRSQPGSGFRRKDNLDQHLRGPHKQSTVPRLRARSKAKVAQGDSALVAPSDATGSLAQSYKKRKREVDEGVPGSSEAGLREELIEERKARKLAEEENQELRQKIEDCERRIIKHEETLDTMMSLLSGRNGKGEETI